MKQPVETRQQAYNRITNGLRRYMFQTIEAMKLVSEAKEKEIWKEKFSSWKEWVEKEFGTTVRRADQLLEITRTINEISNEKPFLASDSENKAILHNLSTRQAHALKGLPPAKKADVLDAAIKESGGKSPSPETIRSIAHRDYSDVYLSRPRDEIDPADKISKSTSGDVSAAVKLSDVYPKTLKFEAFTLEEENAFYAWTEATMAARGRRNGKTKIDLRDAIIKICNAYKKVTGKKLPVKPMDAGQLRRLLETGITLEEFIAVGEKAWVSKNPKNILCGQSHQVAMFVKHYANIRNEVEPSFKEQSSNPQNYLQ